MTIADKLEETANILTERLGQVELLTLNRAKSRNSLSESVIDQLTAELVRVGNDKTVRVVVLASTGTAFCAGHDLKELELHRQDADGGRSFYERTFAKCSTLMQTIVNLPQPVIACVQGVATAAGCQLVASCDLAVAADNSKFATPGVDIGLFCSTPMVALSRNVNSKHAMELLLTGELISAEHACRIGLVNRVVEAGKELEISLALAETIAQKSGRALRTGKKAFYAQAQLSLSEAYEYTGKIMVENLLDIDAREGICAFLEKRRPNWQNV
ncbi:MAG TPA: enoyl-CoA hydratase [Drouetiella sp.]|jgi:enoyl-CoA hydratase/carnithine racemase